MADTSKSNDQRAREAREAAAAVPPWSPDTQGAAVSEGVRTSTTGGPFTGEVRTSTDASTRGAVAGAGAEPLGPVGVVGAKMPPEGEAEAVSAFAEGEGFSEAEVGLMKAQLQARRDGSAVSKAAHANMTPERIAAVGEALDRFIEQRRGAATGKQGR